jgi:hypothetical protein
MAMRGPEIRRRLKGALEMVRKRMRVHGEALGAPDLTGTGYAGGYGQALRDLLSLIGGHTLPNTRGYWTEVEPFGIRKTLQGLAGRINSVLGKVKAEMRGHGHDKCAPSASRGYAQALRDVLLLMDGPALPNTGAYWEEPLLPVTSGEYNVG